MENNMVQQRFILKTGYAFSAWFGPLPPMRYHVRSDGSNAPPRITQIRRSIVLL